MKPEAKARKEIDRLLAAAGWQVQDMAGLDLGAGPGVAVREFPLTTGAADYVLFVDRKAVGAIEAKPAGTTLSGVAEQSGKYMTRLPPNTPHVAEPLPFAYDDLLQRDKVSLGISWLRDESLEDTERLPEPDVLARQIVENLEAALEQFRGLAEELEEGE